MMAVAAAPLRYTAPGSSEMSSSGVSSATPQTSQANGSTATLQMLANQQYQPYYLRPAYRFKTNTPQMPIDMMADGPGRRLRKNVTNIRRHIDYIANVLNYVEARLWQSGIRDREALQPDILYQNCALPASATLDKPVDCILTKFVRAAMNKVKCPIYSVCWTPEGKRLITGASTGEFTLWNGTAFNFETILQAHDSAIRALKWSHNDQWLVSADHDGFVKYWQPNMNNVHMYQAHKDEPIRSISFAPTDAKIVTGSDDGTARIWDFAKCAEEKVLRGHGSDVRSVDWHPQKGLVCTGSRDSQQPVKLWDPKSGLCLATLHEHKNSVMAVQWNKNGNWLLTGSKDHLIKMYDIRMMREMYTYRGHKKEVTALAWHPIHESLFVSGGGDGSLAYWLVNNEKKLGFLEHAHDQAVWTLEWHPLGHILASGSNDNNTKFWSRNRPGDTQEDIFGLASFSSSTSHTTVKEQRVDTDEEVTAKPVIPGMGLDDDVFQELEKKETQQIVGGPSTGAGALGGPLLVPEDPNARMQSANIGAKRTLIKQPPPKKAQRQFERMWNVAKPTGGDDFDEEMPEEGSFRRTKTSLLGPPPPSMLSTSKSLEGQRSFSPQPLSYKGDHSNPTQSNTHSAGSQRMSSSNNDLGITIAEAQQQKKAQTTTLPSLAQLRLPSSSPNQPWASPSQAAAAAAAAALIQQVNSQNTLVHTQTAIQQEAISAPYSVTPIASLPFSQATAVGSQLIWPPLLQSQPQNLDIDYRTGGAASSLVMASVVAPGATGADDVDLRNQQASSSSSWRTPASTSSDTHLHSPRDIESDSMGSSKIHDPRMRRGSSRNSSMNQLDRDSDGPLNTGKSLLGPPPLQMRDPRRKPQSSQASQKSDGDYESRYENHKAPSRTWMPTMNDSGSQPYNGPRSTANESSASSRNKGYGSSNSSGSRGSYDDYDGRGSYSKQCGNNGGGPMRRGTLIDRGRGRDRNSRRQAY